MVLVNARNANYSLLLPSTMYLQRGFCFFVASEFKRKLPYQFFFSLLIVLKWKGVQNRMNNIFDPFFDQFCDQIDLM